MRRFRAILLVFSAALLGLLALLVQRAMRSLEIERRMRHQTVAERVFDEMERGLTQLIEREDARPFDTAGTGGLPSEFAFVLGHFSVDPDGTVRAHAAARANAPAASAAAEIEAVVTGYWRAARAAPRSRATTTQSPGTTVEIRAGTRPDAAGAEPKARDERSTGQSASTFDALRSLNKGVQQRAERQKFAPESRAEQDKNEASSLEGAPAPPTAAAPAQRFAAPPSETELPPLTGRVTDARHLVLSRPVVRSGQVVRQGLLLDVERLGLWLREQGLGSDGLGAAASVSFATPFAGAAVPAAPPVFVYQHRFAEPFADLTARLALRPLPGIGSGTYVYALSALLLATAVLGLGALYRMVSVVVSFAERRSNFVAAVSHELKTPLTAIRLYGEMLRDGLVPTDAKRAEYYGHITTEAERLSRLINNVLELSRLEKGQRGVALTTGSIESTVREAAALLRPHVEAEGFDLHLEIGAPVPAVRFEHDALVQVLCNLVDNAVKYAHGASSNRIALRCRHDGTHVYVEVRDHGPGVAARHLGKIFEPFYRGESELTRRSKGTGIGLALVRGLTERMGATVTGRNVPDGGFEVAIAFRAVA